MAKPNAVQNGAHLKHMRNAINGARPNRLTRRPITLDVMAMPFAKNHIHMPIMAHEADRKFSFVEHHNAIRIKRHRVCRPHLARNGALTLIQRVINDSGDRSKAMSHFALWWHRSKALRKFLRNKTCRETTRFPPRMFHQSGDEGNIVTDPFNRKCIKRPRLRFNRFKPCWRVGHKLGNHRIIIDRDFAPFINARVIAHRHIAEQPFLRRTIGHKPPR